MGSKKSINDYPDIPDSKLSTDTVLNLVINDILLTLNNQHCIQLVLLDL